MNTTAVGRAAEDYVAEQLRQRGGKIIARNIRTRFYELDLIILKDNCLHFVEVRYRRNNFAGGGHESIDRTKLNRLTRAVESWTSEHPSYEDYNISLDAACVTGEIDKFILSYLSNITG